MRQFTIAVALFATLAHSLAGAERAGKADERVQKLAAARPDELRLQFHLPNGMTWPDGFLPEVYSEEVRDEVRSTWQPTNPRNAGPDPYSAGIRPIGTAAFAVPISHLREPFYVAIFAPRFLRFFERGPFTQDGIKDGRLEIPVEKPGILEVRFDGGTTKGKDLPFDRQMLTVMRMRSRNMYLWAAYREDLPLGVPTRIADLAAGDYRITASTHPKAELKPVRGTDEQPVNPGRYYENAEVHVAAGQIRRIDLHYTPPDSEAFRGRRTAVVRLRKRDGQPAKGVKISIDYRDAHYGAIPVFAGLVPESGEIVLKGITDRVPECVWSQRGYRVGIGQDPRLLGNLKFQTRSDTETFTFQLPPDVGDMAPDIDLMSVAGNRRTKLSSLRGKLVCLDFWLTWCPYCQETIEKLDRARAPNRDRWNGRVAVVPISLDEEPETVVRHVTKRGWNHLEHYWAGSWTAYPLDTVTARAFALDFAPKTYLIGADGRILWSGHPLAKVSGKDIMVRIDEMLKRGSITEKPTTVSGSGTASKNEAISRR